MSKRKDTAQENGIERRSILKALAGLPVLGALGIETLRKLNYDAKKIEAKAVVPRRARFVQER